MMSNPYHFGVGQGHVSERRAKQLDAIAKAYGGYFVAADLPDGERYWFSVPNEGAPFDEQTATEILAVAKEQGLWPIGR